MGRLVEALAPDYGWEIAGVLDGQLNVGGEALGPGSWPDVDVAIDFSTAAAVEQNLRVLRRSERTSSSAPRGGMRPVRVSGPWPRRPVLACSRRPTSSTGVVLFGEIVKAAGALLAPHAEYGAWLHELHHSAKRDAPSGTALSLKGALEGPATRDDRRRLDARRSHPGNAYHGFDAPSETITLTHAVRDRGTFARGALTAATWLRGRRGWFTMHDCLGLNDGGAR